MKIIKDREAGAVYIYLKNQGRIDKTTELSPSINIDYDKNGEILGIEFLNIDKVEIG